MPDGRVVTGILVALRVGATHDGAGEEVQTELCRADQDRLRSEVTPEVDPKVMGLPRFFWELCRLKPIKH